MEPYLGEIRYVGFNFAPPGWAFCDGSLLSISQNQVLFNLIGTTYGGNGTTTFALPDLRGRVPVHQGQGSGLSSYPLGQIGGTESVTLSLAQLPAHSHSVAASANTGTTGDPTAGVFAKPNLVRGGNLYASTSDSPTASGTIVATGGSQSHENRAPVLTLNPIIATQGIYPSPN